MPEEAIPEDIRRFVLQSIDSVALLEALLLMRSQPQQEWDADTLSRRLYISAAETGRILNSLRAQGLCEVSDKGYRYQPERSEQAVLVDRLAQVYAQRLIAITHLIHQRGSGKSSAQSFADAFKLRKDPE